jgi:alcohol dehydrogenase, propanol-preferring
VLRRFKLNEPSPFEGFFRCRTLTGSVEGIQYAKAVCYRVIGIDISPEALLEAKAQSAEHVFNPIKDTDYVPTIKQLTNKGCKTVINFTNSVAAYAAVPDILHPNGLLLVVSIPPAATYL